MMNGVKIEIVSASVETISGTSKKTGQPYSMRKQEAFLHNGHAYPDRFSMTLGKDSSGVDLPAYAPGFYTLAPASIQVNREFGKLEINGFDMQLLRLVDEAPKAAKAA